jgi:AraC family transcriptional regulator
MEWIETLQRAINYIEAHLLDEINYEDVARQVNMSSYEFHRAFSFMSGMTANAYIRNRRLSLAGRELLETNAKVIDIALKYGYDTPESFTKAFTRFHGVAPKYAKIEGTQLSLFNPLVIKIIMEGGKNMDYRIETTKSQKFIAMVRSFSNEIINDEENHEIPDFWSECKEKKLIKQLSDLRPLGKKDFYGLCSPTKEGEETFNYGIGILLNEDTVKFDEESMHNAGYRIWDVEPGTYAVFKCIGEDGECIGDMWSRFYKEFLPQMGYKAADATDYEVYFDKGEPGVFCELWIPIKKK